MVEPACDGHIVAGRQLDRGAGRLDSDPGEDGEVVAGGSRVTGNEIEEPARGDVRGDGQRAARTYLRDANGIR